MLTATPNRSHQRRTAAIDIGSNTARALAACRCADGFLEPYLEAEATTALGKGLALSGRMGADAIRETALFVRDFLRQAGPLDAVYCVGTAASRRAANIAELQEALGGLGVELEVIAGEAEAELSYAGALAGALLPPEAAPAVVDIGGGSTELVRHAAQRLCLVSAPVGSRTLTEAALHSDPPTRAQVSEARRLASQALEGALAVLEGAEQVVAAGGTAVSAARLAGGRWRLSRSRIQALRRQICRMELPERREALSFDPPRAELICGGLVLLEIIAEAAPAGPLLISSTGLREGLLLKRTGARGIRPLHPGAM